MRQRLAGKVKGLRGRYNLVLGTPPESLDKTELAVLLALTPQLTELSNLPGFDPTDVTVQLTFKSGHIGCAKLEKPDTDHDEEQQ